MKINPVGINAYQQVARTGRINHPANTTNAADARLRVEPQKPGQMSKVAVRPRVADKSVAMTSSEQNALENLLKVIGERKGTGAGYTGINRPVENPEVVGSFIDVKV